jgi:hypothetical protein
MTQEEKKKGFSQIVADQGADSRRFFDCQYLDEEFL